MPAPKIPLTNLSKGEFSPKLWARPDIPQYAAGVKKAKNFIIQKEAGMAFRPGFRFAGEVRDVDGTYRMEPFILSSKQAAVRVFGDFGQEVLAQGGFVVEDDLQIVSVTYGTTTTIEVPFHAFEIGDRLELTGNTGPNISNRVVTVTAVPDANHITVALVSTGEPALTASTGIVRVGAPAPPPRRRRLFPIRSPLHLHLKPAAAAARAGGDLGDGPGGFPGNVY